MMKHIVLTLLLCFLTLPFAGCREGKDTAATLAEAEALMYTYPDSARQMLEAIPRPERLTGREQADYALLLTQARHRCNVIATSDSLIQIAVNYFDNQGNKPMSAKASRQCKCRQEEEVIQKLQLSSIKTLVIKNTNQQLASDSKLISKFRKNIFY